MAFDPDDARQADTYDEASLWSAQAASLLLDAVPMTARRVLDVGCGAGFPLLELAERLGPGTLAAGLDPWRAAFDRARAKRDAWPVPQAWLVRGDGAAMPFRDGAFDLVVSNLGVNNFADPDGAFAECRRVLEPGGALVLSSNLVGHFREFYDVFAELLARTGDHEAQERLRVHVAHRATVAGLRAALGRHGFRVETVTGCETTWRFRDGSALLAHHFMRLGFVQAWQEVAGGPDASLEPLRAALDERAAGGPLSFTVPLAAIVARASVPAGATFS
jgi:ubiquinone/menaquinone biosynthesis C-methylase UbiE